MRSLLLSNKRISVFGALVVMGLPIILFAAFGRSGALAKRLVEPDISRSSPSTSGTLNWNQLNPAAQPSVRSYHTMAYDAARSQVVMFGGFGAGNAVLGDTWIWDGVNWIQK